MRSSYPNAPEIPDDVPYDDRPAHKRDDDAFFEQQDATVEIHADEIDDIAFFRTKTWLIHLDVAMDDVAMVRDPGVEETPETRAFYELIRNREDDLAAVLHQRLGYTKREVEQMDGLGEMTEALQAADEAGWIDAALARDESETDTVYDPARRTIVPREQYETENADSGGDS